MSRFSRLEFNAFSRPQHSEAEQSLGTTPRTASECLTTAREAAQRGAFEDALQWFTRALKEDRSMIPAWVGQVQMLIDLREYQEADLWSTKALELFKNNGELHSARSQALLRLDDRTNALAASDSALKAPGSSPYRWRARGEIMLKREPDNARRCFDRSITESDADWFDRVQIARIYLFHDYPAAALPWADAAHALEPSHGYVHLIRGICHEELGLSENATQSYITAIERIPRLQEARDRLSHLANQSRVTTALRRFKGWFRR